MVLFSFSFWPQQNYWSKYSLNGIDIEVQPPNEDDINVSPGSIPPFFWNKSFRHRIRNIAGLKQRLYPVHRGYSEVRVLIKRGTVDDVKNLSNQALNIVTQVFRSIKVGSESSPLDDITLPSMPATKSGPVLVRLKLSSDLENWKETQRTVRNVLPPKGTGLIKASEEILGLLGAADWPEALQTNNALFGCGFANLLMGAADASTMFSNYVTDMVFYYEHGYNYVFPSLKALVEKGLMDPHALGTPGGHERRAGVRAGKRYIQAKIALETGHKSHLSYQSARLGRRDAQIVSLSESSLLGMATEAMARGWDPAAAVTDLIFTSPGTDVVDVGSDLLNSEVMNSFLNVGDITDTGIVSEDVLRRVYDAYAATGARMLTERWYEPVARVCAVLYTWHIQNDRHMFLRRAILGWPKARQTPAQPQREADFDEAFDEEYHTTGFSRPLQPKYECNGEDTCDHVSDFLRRNSGKPLLRDLWWFLVIGPLEYVRGGKIDEWQEQKLVEGSRLRMAQLFSHGVILEMMWLIAHANHHAWQVNYLFEAAMFGSILDGGKLIGKLDRCEDGNKAE